MEDADFEQYEIEMALRDNGRSQALERVERHEIEKASFDRKEVIRRAKDKAAVDMANMGTFAMEAMLMGLQSEDEGIRMKALAMWLDRNTSRQGIVREEEVIEVEDVGKKLSLEEIEIVLRKKGMIDGAEDGS